MKGIIYIRVSSDEQVKGTSLEFQEDLCRKYCEQKGIEIVEIFREEGETAKDLSLSNRKKFLEALEYCRKNKDKIQAFIVLKVDRFARNTEDHFAVRKILLDYGVTLHSVTEPIGNKPAEKFIETVLAGAAEYDNAVRKQRCSDGMLTRMKQGIWPWPPPIGYECAHFKRRGEKKTEPDPPHKQTFPIIQRALKEYVKGLSSQVELAKLMDEWGLKAIRGKKTTPQLVDRMLGKNLKFYAGIIVNPWTREEIQGLHKAMISKEEAYQIQLVRSGKARMAKRNRYNPDFPLRRTVICGHCNRPLTGSSPRGNGGRYFHYHCYNKQCPMFGKSITKKELEREFMEYLKRITPTKKFITTFRETVFDLWQEKGQNFDLEAQKYGRQLTLLEEKKKRIYEMREDGSYVKEEFLERKAEVENKITATKISLSEARIEQFDIEAAVIYATNFISDLGRQWFDIPEQLRPRFQKRIFPEGIPYKRNEGFGTAKLGLIYEVNEHFDGKKSSLVDLRRFELLTSSMPWRHSAN